ncbi:uncharacterized small protein (DUF1192 family) [Microbacteriaceae bacterium SG_E_30_P1]|uniref:Uncharacterized small protein (DUF1192 family) n=1 Tax=Antiquaquibacter oligotrophicus TaxID=2880260 RepID=A0ABT6KJU5_9MICO|nr:DUF4349 domain-containing protein [Antiquaquibacter oligotrophicus]MDH6180215.1 uncharacterized small protein (DUF1192 family) [Antiquaquibacter oligotrophicus]UDF14038.1 DUF4349 domain-containing protein [Antiquaquibacter oligotrophicus]
MRRILLIPTALVLGAIALTGCSAGGADSASAPAPEVEYQSSEGGSVAVDEMSTDPTQSERQVIVTGWMTVTVEQPLEAASEAIRIAESVGGRVDGRNEYAPADGNRGSATLTLRLPAEGLTETLDRFKELGEVQEISLDSSDVTMATQDLDARISALSASIERLEALLATATDTENLIALETAISDRQAQLESMQAERRYYADQVALSTVTLNLVSTEDAPVERPITFIDGLVAGWNAFVGFFAGLLVVLGVLLPWIILAAIITAAILFFLRWRRSRRVAQAPEEPAAASLPPTHTS